MFSKIWTKKSTNDCSGPIDTLRQVLSHADAVVIGAGAGLSTSAGFTYDGERFRELFCTILEDAEEQWVENHPGGALRQGAEAFCRDALEKFARQLLRRCCAPF